MGEISPKQMGALELGALINLPAPGLVSPDILTQQLLSVILPASSLLAELSDKHRLFSLTVFFRHTNL